MASVGLSACMVASAPGWPVLMAFRKAKASEPLNSPIRMRSGRSLNEASISQSYLSGDLLNDEDSMLDLQGHSITYRIAVGPQKGQKVLTLQMLPASPEQTSSKDLIGKVEGLLIQRELLLEKQQFSANSDDLELRR